MCSCDLDTIEEDIECTSAIYRGKVKNGPTNYSLVDLFEDKHPYTNKTTYCVTIVCNSANLESAFIVDFMNYLGNRSDIQYEITVDSNENNIVLELSSMCIEDNRIVEFTRTQTFYPKKQPYKKCSIYSFVPLYVTNMDENYKDDKPIQKNSCCNNFDFSDILDSDQC